jgi:hypothetical protein
METPLVRVQTWGGSAGLFKTSNKGFTRVFKFSNILDRTIEPSSEGKEPRLKLSNRLDFLKLYDRAYYMQVIVVY